MSTLALKSKPGKSGKASKSATRKKTPLRKVSSGKMRSGSEVKKTPEPPKKQGNIAVKPVKINVDQKPDSIKNPLTDHQKPAEKAIPSLSRQKENTVTPPDRQLQESSQKSETSKRPETSEQPASQEKRIENPAASKLLSPSEAKGESVTPKPEGESQTKTDSGFLSENTFQTINKKTGESTKNAVSETFSNTTSTPENLEGDAIDNNVSIDKTLGNNGKGSQEDGAVQAVVPLTLEGSSDQAIQSFASAGASQMAASFSILGEAVTGKLNKEQKEASESMPVLTAQMNGMEALPVEEVTIVKNDASDIGDGVTSAEPTPLKVNPHTGHAPAPENKKNKQLLKNKKSGGGFFSWLRNAFSDLLSGIATRDPGLNTSAGRPTKINTVGKADPQRAKRQKAKSKTAVDTQKNTTIEQIRTHPGQQNIQPLNLNNPVEVNVSATSETTIETIPQNDMERFAAIPLPASVRRLTDQKMAPALEANLSLPKQEVLNAAKQKEIDKNSATLKAQHDANLLNTQAETDQNNAVLTARGEVAEKQRQGIMDSQEKMNRFNTEMNDEETRIKKGVDDKITSSDTESGKILNKAEADAEKEKAKGEKKARKEKAQLKKNSENESWWDKATSAIESAVSAVMDSIDNIFKEVRRAVKAIIETAKKTALDLIEKGRNWIIKKLDDFGKWAKSKVDTYLSHFPVLREKLNTVIDSAVNSAKNAVNKVAEKLKAGVEALAARLSSAIDGILKTFQTAMKAAVGVMGALLTGNFSEAAKIAFYAVCEIAGIDPNPILNFINRAGDTISIIFNDPGAFFNNVANGVGKGIGQFSENIKKHLLNGLIGWLTGALSAVQITLPEKFDLKGIFSLVMQLLGLTYTNIRTKMVKAIGPKGETVVSAMEKTVDVIKDVVKRGPIALWERIKESLSNLKETVMSGIRDWVITKVIQGGITWLLSLLNPVSAIVKAVKMLYDVVMFFVNRYQQISTFVQSVFDSVGELARGNLSKAANAVENALGRSVPVVIGFLGSLIGLGGVGKAIKNIIEKVRKPIDNALDGVIKWIVDKGKNLFGKGKEAVKNLAEWWKMKLGFTTKSGKHHSLSFKGKGKSAKLIVSSDPTPIRIFIDKSEQKGADKTKIQQLRTLVDKIELEKARPEPSKDKIHKPFKKIVKLAAELFDVDDMGTKANPIPMVWPKRQSAKYPEIYLGPKSEKRIPQTDLKGLEGKRMETVKAKNNFSWLSGVKKWHPVRKYTPHSRNVLPGGGKKIGLTTTNQIKTGKKFKLPNVHQETPGGGKLINPLRKYGYHFSDEGKHADHVLEIQMGGKDVIQNLWPLNGSENSSGGSTLAKMKFGEDKKVTMPELKQKAAKGTPVWFKIASTKPA